MISGIMGIGDTYRNNDAYNGECDIMIVEFLADGWVKVVHCNCQKYPNLKGQTEEKHKKDIENYYHKIN